MADYLAMDAAAVARHIDALLVAYPDLVDDEALRADMLEGETDLHHVVSRALDHRQEAETMAAAIKLRETDLGERRSRYEKRSEAMKALIKSLMVSAGQNTLTLPEATISLTKARETVSIIDIDALPQGTFTTIRQPDKKAIKASIDAGEAVPGAALVKGEASITVRTK